MFSMPRGLQNIPERFTDLDRPLMNLVKQREFAVIAETAENLLPFLEPFRNLRKEGRFGLAVYECEHVTAHGMEFKAM
jgi:hypothetical protein